MHSKTFYGSKYKLAKHSRADSRPVEYDFEMIDGLIKKNFPEMKK
jgi:hypothetical protein